MKDFRPMRWFCELSLLLFKPHDLSSAPRTYPCKDRKRKPGSIKSPSDAHSMLKRKKRREERRKEGGKRMLIASSLFLKNVLSICVCVWNTPGNDRD